MIKGKLRYIQNQMPDELGIRRKIAQMRREIGQVNMNQSRAPHLRLNHGGPPLHLRFMGQFLQLQLCTSRRTTPQLYLCAFLVPTYISGWKIPTSTSGHTTPHLYLWAFLVSTYASGWKSPPLLLGSASPHLRFRAQNPHL